MGGYLTCLETVEEQMTVVKLKRRGKVVWVGGTRDKSRRLIWINGMPIKQPILIESPGYRYVAFSVNADFKVRPDSGRTPKGAKYIHGFICEWDE